MLGNGFKEIFDFEFNGFYTTHPEFHEEIWLGDESHSHFTLFELLDTTVSFDETYLYEWINDLIQLKKKYRVPLSSIRVVFGFDN